MLNRLTARSQRTDRMLVAGPRRYVRTVVALELAWFVVAVAAWALYDSMRGVAVVAASLVIGVQIGRASLTSLRRAGAYRSGWLDGRSQMVAALSEAQRRGMSPREWLEGELARDWAVLGVPMPPDEDELS